MTENERETVLTVMTTKHRGEGTYLSTLRFEVSRELKITEHRAGQVIDELATEGVLTKIGHGPGRTVWQAQEYAAYAQAHAEYRQLVSAVLAALRERDIHAADYGLYRDSVVVSTRDLARFLGIVQ